MDYLRETINSDSLASIFDLPVSLRNRNVDVIILPAKTNKGTTANTKSAKGCLRKYANPALIPEEDGAWAKAMVDKYADR